VEIIVRTDCNTPWHKQYSKNQCVEVGMTNLLMPAIQSVLVTGVKCAGTIGRPVAPSLGIILGLYQAAL